ncbi:AP-3 complex subunit mu-1 [Rhynchospora pubera]|uniref:AP-3 complex subunit mu-1 n=1 Tax=Rhynchospora pubera TaxID=906938 RepID=A0AAV8HBG3_9POAL|nr:AP-3 complex subunit mu-1 [Rhynchospora pubera]
MVEKQMMGHHVDRSICAWFWHQYNHHRNNDQMSVVTSPTHYLFPLIRHGIIFLACTQLELPPLLPIEFLSRFADILSDYLCAGSGAGATLNEDIVKDNFVIVYEVLDEMMDNGFPLTTEPNLLKDIVLPPNLVTKVLHAVTGNSSPSVGPTLPHAAASTVPWRSTHPKTTTNEVYVNLVEQLDASVNWDGNLRRCQVYGEIQVNSSLPGFPDLTLSFTNPSLLNDVRFHPCVRFRPWESSQVLSFVPPDGHFKLMTYRVKELKKIPIYVKPQLTSDSGNCRISALVGVRNDPGKTIDSIIVEFQLPPCITSADLTSNHGTVDILADKTCRWSIGQIPKDKLPSLSGNLVLEPGLDRLHVAPTFQVRFKIMGIAMSGLQIDKLDVKNMPANPYKGFRAQTQAGDYEFRS